MQSLIRPDNGMVRHRCTIDLINILDRLELISWPAYMEIAYKHFPLGFTNWSHSSDLFPK